MKVLMTTDTVGGVFTYTAGLVAGLRGDAEVVVAAMGAPLRKSQRAALLAAGAVAVYDGGHALEWMPEPWPEVEAAGAWLLELEATERPDVVHLNGYAHAALPWSVPCVVVGHSCVLSWWRAVQGETAPPSWNRYRSAVRDGLRAADVVVAPTAHMLDELRDLYAPWSARGIVISNGVASTGSSASPIKEPFVLGAGRMWDDAKNLVGLDRAAAELPWPVLVAGPLAGPGQLTEPMRPRHIMALGELAPRELRAMCRRAAIFAAPARYEPFGLAILEAAIDRCALVLGDIPSLRELWDGAARFVAPDDHPALHATLRELIGDRAQRDQLGRLACRRAADYGARETAAGYRELYASLAAAVGAPS